MKPDIAEKLTNWFLKSIEEGAGQWVQPWNSGNAAGRLAIPKKHDGTPYKGANVPILWMTAQERGFDNATWMTFPQAKALGGCVRKGESSSQSIFYKQIGGTEKDGAGEEVDKSYRLLKTNNIFNVDQIDGLPERFYRKPEPVILNAFERIEWAESYLDNVGADVRYGGTRAYYNRAADFIQMPLRELFNDAVAHYTTRFHETAHYSESRVGIDFKRKGYGSEGYALGEVVAEMAGSFWAAAYGLELQPRPEHAAYVAGWHEKVAATLRANNRAILMAAADAQKIVDFTDSLQPGSADGRQPVMS